MNINLKIEILKVFTLDFSLSSEKELKLKKDQEDEKASSPKPADGKPASAGK